MKKVLCVGEALIDMICTDKGKSLTEGEYFIKKAGGAPANVAAAIAALGGEVELAAKVGKDPFGTYLINMMHSFGVSTKWMLQDENHFTTLAFVSLMENGERDFYFSRGADAELCQEEVDSINLKEFSIFHFGSATAFLPGPLQNTYKTLLQKSMIEDIFISFDPNYRSLLFQNKKQNFIEQSWYYLNNCHFFKVSDEEAMMITNSEDITTAAAHFLEKTNAVFAITLGKDGALLGINGKTEMIPGIVINPIDTTGAGDAFVGAVLFQLSDKSIQEIKELSVKQWLEIIFKANKAGARTCEYVGASESYKHLKKEIFD